MTRNQKIIAGGIAALIAGFLFLQIWQYSQDVAVNPPVQQEPNWDTAQTRHLAERACFDCHSNETSWPWYARVSPISLMLQRDVLEGREALNFSEWDANCCTQAEIDAMSEVMGKDRMPLPYYLVLHPEAQLTRMEKGQLVYGLIATMQNGE